MFGSPGASCGYTSSSVEQVEHSIVAILEVTGLIAFSRPIGIMPVPACAGQLDWLMADMSRWKPGESASDM
jgi:hypothetical protein